MKFKKVHTTRDLAISTIVIVAGIGLYFLNAGLGGVIAACGFLMLLFYTAGYKKEGDNILLNKKALDVSVNCRPSLKDFLDGKDVDPEVVPSEKNGIIRLEVYYNVSSAVAYAQLFDYSSYTYVAATDIVELHGQKAIQLINKL